MILGALAKLLDWSQNSKLSHSVTNFYSLLLCHLHLVHVANALKKKKRKKCKKNRKVCGKTCGFSRILDTVGNSIFSPFLIWENKNRKWETACVLLWLRPRMGMLLILRGRT